MPNMAITTLGDHLDRHCSVRSRVLILRLSTNVRQRPARHLEPRHRHAVPGRPRRRRQRHRRAVRRLRRRRARRCGAWISPNKTVEGLIGGALDDVRGMFVVGISECERHVEVADAPVAAGDRDRDLRPARRPHREHVQAQPRHQGLRDDRQGPRRRPRPLRRLPVHAASGLLPDHGARALDRRADAG